MSEKPLIVAVVGHTNTGKTSLLRTLTRDAGFGEVSDRPATTRHVEGAAVLVNGRPVLELYDTPGLEDSIGLLDHLDSLASGRRAQGIELIEKFLSSNEAGNEFAQEAKALRQVMASDVALYVIDARDRVLGKHSDELNILARCAKPVVPVLNFIADEDAKVSIWREHLSRANMHAVAEFDTVVLDELCEQRLFEKMRTLLDGHEDQINRLIEDRHILHRDLMRASAQLVADMLIDVAAYVTYVETDDSQQTEESLDALRRSIRNREQRCVDQLLELHRFGREDCLPDTIPMDDGKWGYDLFSPEAMKQFGLTAGGGIAAGAATGFVLDAMSGGLSGGAMTVIGAAIGGVFGAGRAHGKRLIRKAQGETELRCDDQTLRLLALRQLRLTRALLRRGHASQKPLVMPKPGRLKLPQTSAPLMPSAIQLARTKSQWSRIAEVTGGFKAPDPARLEAVSSLTQHLLQLLKQDDDKQLEFP